MNHTDTKTSKLFDQFMSFFEPAMDGNLEKLMNHFHPDVTINCCGGGAIPHSGVFKGRKAVAERWINALNFYEVTILEPIEIMERDNKLITIYHFEGSLKASGNPVAYDLVCFVVFKDDLIYSYQDFLDTHKIAQAC